LFQNCLVELGSEFISGYFPGSLLIQVCQRTTFYLYLPIPIHHHHHHLRIMLMLSTSMDGKITFPRLLTSWSLKDLKIKIHGHTFYSIKGAFFFF
jgi:UV DNA damage repair endonuclease